MKLVVMIPAFNEGNTISDVIREIPRKMQGVDSVRVLVIDDGSDDGTVEAARKAGADRIITHTKNRGLAVSFKDGFDEALQMGADIIVNTDADFQYNQKEIPRIIGPILEGKADVVLTDRNVWKLLHMPFSKKAGNTISTIVTSFLAGFNVRDAQSGFRAFSREAALRINVLSQYTYVQETIIQAANKKLKIVQVPCEFRKRGGKSRLISSLFSYAKSAGVTIITTYTHYRPLKVFGLIGGLIFISGLVVGLRVIVHFIITGTVSPFIPSAILSGFLLVIGFQVILLGLIGDAIRANRTIQEELLYRKKKEDCGKGQGT